MEKFIVKLTDRVNAVNDTNGHRDNPMKQR